MKDNALYLEADEDITSAIDKLGKSAASSVQIVVPKRSTMLQSIINLKLLKKAAEGHGKELVLVTNDKIAGELAARVGLAVAPSLGAKAIVSAAKSAPKSMAHDEEVIEADEPDERPAPAGGDDADEADDNSAEEASAGSDTEDEMSAAASTSALATLPEKKASKRPPILKRRELSDTSDEPDASGKDAKAAAGLKIPNFGNLQRRLLWVVLAVFLFGGYWAFMYFFTSAKVVLFANGTRTSIDTTFAVNSAGGTTDLSGGVLAGQKITFSKDLNSTFTPTGQQDIGTKATGTMTVSNGSGVDQPLVAGTRFQAPDGKIFRSNSDIDVPGATVDKHGNVVKGSQSVDVTADQNGDGYNEAAATYTIPALSSPLITAEGSQMSGGTSKTVTIVAQSDVDTAKAAAVQKDQSGSSQDLSGKLPSGYMAVPGSQSSNTDSVQSAPDVGSQGTTATLSLKVTYTVLAVKKSDYDALVHAQEQKQVGDQNQIYDDGLGGAQVTSSGQDASGRPSFHFTTDAISGTKIDTAAVAKQIKGARYGDATNTVKGLPGVSDANISLWPGWASSLPAQTGKIQVTIQANNK